MTDPTPDPAALYAQAAGDPVAYRRLLTEHGHLVPRARDGGGHPVYSLEELAQRRADPAETLAATVHAAWRDGSLALGRDVDAERLLWATLSPEDQSLGRAIAGEAIRVMHSLSPDTDLARAAREYAEAVSVLAGLQAAERAAHDEHIDARGMVTGAPGSYQAHMAAMDARQEQEGRIARARNALCRAALAAAGGER